MHEASVPVPLKENVVDKVAHSADKAVDATKTAATAALDSVSHKVESVRSTLSPALNGVIAPLDKIVKFTWEWPVVALLIAASSAALLSTLIRTGRHARNR